LMPTDCAAIKTEYIMQTTVIRNIFFIPFILKLC
jgi:hypothetical protein